MSESNFGGRKILDASKRARRLNFSDARRKLARENAEERQKHRNSLSDAQQLLVLDKRPGSSTRERARLSAKMQKHSAPVTVEKTTDSQPEEVKKTKKSRKGK